MSVSVDQQQAFSVSVVYHQVSGWYMVLGKGGRGWSVSVDQQQAFSVSVVYHQVSRWYMVLGKGGEGVVSISRLSTSKWWVYGWEGGRGGGQYQ